MRFLALMMALLPLQAQAQEVALGDYEAAQTRFGLLATFRASYQTQLLFEGALVAEDHRIKILGAYAREGEAHDWAVAETWHGGNMCPNSYILLKISAQGVSRTEPFGSCEGGLRALRLLPGAIEAELSTGSLLTDAILFRFDGASMTRTEVATPAPVGPMAGAGTAVTRWIGQHPTRPLADPTEQLRFLQIMTRQELEEFRGHISVAGKAQQVGGWVFGRGCMPHQCGSSFGGWGIRISDGAVVAFWGTLDWGITNARGAREHRHDPQVVQYFDGWQY